MRRLLIRNPDLTGVEKTFLTSAYTSGTTLSVVNSFAFAANDLLLVGAMKEEKAEIKKIITVPSDTSLTLASALKFSHGKETTVYKIPWDNVEISSKPSGGSFSVISTSGLQLDKDDTVYVDSGGDATTSYRWRFYNSVSVTYSEYSPTFTGAGFSRNQVGFILRNVRKIARADLTVVSDAELIREINTAQEIIYGTRKNWWFLKFTDPTGIATSASSFRYNLDLINGGVAGTPTVSTVLGYIDKVKYQYSDGTINQKYNLNYKPEAEFDELITDANRATDNWVTQYTLRAADSSSQNGYIEIFPTPKTTGIGTLFVTAFNKIAEINDAIDTVVTPIPSIIENYLLSYVSRIQGNDQKGELYESLFYGPAPTAKDRQRLMGIALIEQLQERNIPTGQPRSLSRFRGQRSMTRLYGNRLPSGSRDNNHVNYW